ncbi:elongation factor Ts-like protein [Sinorhizobium phage phiM7]|uniref:Elongation factor Ts-like protein n=2 Tax=Emdodecavirus TaxID=1980937 RepID=S5MPU4_9CAUD|nr:elongation factor Ts-like protein [Sinorhizobium phage phiM12]YP_009601275.1 elongation factor Ts-like protein [Sinorhizobium phage phiM7]AGR47850.2 elongation factor Ts-like protein [Sinorhizobium phage phiM12]AKF12696.1 elongation factor Ts-like protein [Sinorhizobium phage phiM7]AKF13055.1 elongation factor Ts-like protein [Sinorhizobium phage phiM19]
MVCRQSGDIALNREPLSDDVKEKIKQLRMKVPGWGTIEYRYALMNSNNDVEQAAELLKSRSRMIFW